MLKTAVRAGHERVVCTSAPPGPCYRLLLLDSSPNPFSFSLQTSLQKPLELPPVTAPTSKAANSMGSSACKPLAAEPFPRSHTLPGQTAQVAEQ